MTTNESTLAEKNQEIASTRPPTGKDYDRALVRGALKLEASMSTHVITAGSEFSIYVIIRNPFPVPVIVYSTETHIPVELSDQIWRKMEKKRIQKERNLVLQATVPLVQISTEKFQNEGQAPIPKTPAQKFSYRLRFMLEDLGSMIQPDAGPRVAVAVSTEEQSLQSFLEPGVVNITGDFVGRDKYINYELVFGDMSPEEIQQRLFIVHEHMQGRQPIVLHSGDAVVKHFILKTTRWLTFTPIAYTFQIQVKYQVDDLIHIDTVPFNVNIRAATASSLIGAFMGSILGSIVNPKNTFTGWQHLFVTFLTAVIFAVIIVVAFARKSNVQQIVSVEDFWGGIFIGFLVGYSGETFISQVLGGK